MSATTDMTVAKTILAQLGGGKFIAMTGAKNFIGDENSLSFCLRSGMAKNGSNRVKITLDPCDTYTVQFAKYRALKLTPISEHSDIYCDQLVELFERETGLYCSL